MGSIRSGDNHRIGQRPVPWFARRKAQESQIARMEELDEEQEMEVVTK